MTDLEKAHKSCYEQIIKKDGKKLILLDELKEAYLDGLAEGRKRENENIKKIQEFRKIDQKQILEQMDKISELEEENTELKAKNEQLKQDLKQCSKSLVQIKLEIEKKSKIWKYFESRFVEVCKTCSIEEKAKCIMFPEYCEGECKEFVDLEALLSKACDDSHIS